MQTVFESLIGASVGWAVRSYVWSSCEQSGEIERKGEREKGEQNARNKDGSVKRIETNGTEMKMTTNQSEMRGRKG